MIVIILHITYYSYKDRFNYMGKIAEEKKMWVELL